MTLKDFIPLIAALFALMGVVGTAFITVLIFCITQIILRGTRQLDIKRQHYMDLCGHWKKQELRAISLQTELISVSLKVQVYTLEHQQEKETGRINELAGLKFCEQLTEAFLKFATSLEEAAAALGRVKLCASDRLRRNLVHVDAKTRCVMEDLISRLGELFKSPDNPTSEALNKCIAQTLADLITLQKFMVEARVSMALELGEPWITADIDRLEKNFRQHEVVDVANLSGWALKRFGETLQTAPRA